MDKQEIFDEIIKKSGVRFNDNEIRVLYVFFCVGYSNGYIKAVGEVSRFNSNQSESMFMEFVDEMQKLQSM